MKQINTSAIARQKIVEDGIDKTQKELVYRHLMAASRCLCARDISDDLDIELSSVTARINSLMHDGLIEIAFTEKSPSTRHLVHYLNAVPRHLAKRKLPPAKRSELVDEIKRLSEMNDKLKREYIRICEKYGELVMSI